MKTRVRQPNFIIPQQGKRGEPSSGAEGYRNLVWGPGREHSHQTLALGDGSSHSQTPQGRGKGDNKTPKGWGGVSLFQHCPHCGHLQVAVSRCVICGYDWDAPKIKSDIRHFEGYKDPVDKSNPSSQATCYATATCHQATCYATATCYQEHETRPDEAHADLKGQPWPECAKWTLGGQCSNGHQFWRVLLCGKEWCETCGEEGSWIHQRRIARWLPKIEQLDGYGYWVIEWPKASRYKLRNKEALSEIGKRVKGAMKAMGYDRGLRRWHWFGDKNPGELGWNPHLNLITPGGYLQDRHLERVKAYLRYVLDEPDLIVHYSYRKTISEMLHGLRYITRATFRDKSWDPPMVEVVDGFHNSQAWGKWNGEQLWGLDEDKRISDLEQGKCPICGEPITWDNEPVKVDWLARLNEVGVLVDQGAGYFYQGCGPPPGHITTEPDRNGIAKAVRDRAAEIREEAGQRWLDNLLDRLEAKITWLDELGLYEADPGADGPEP